MLEWDGATRLRTTGTGDLGGLTDLAIHEGEFAAARVDLRYESPRATNDGDGLIVLDRDGLTTLAFLPVTGDFGEWVAGEEIKPVQWINKLTVLVSVLVGDEQHLVTWDTRTGALGYVTSYPASFDVEPAGPPRPPRLEAWTSTRRTRTGSPGSRPARCR